LPNELLGEVVEFDLPPPTAHGANTFAVGICFMPQDPVARSAARDLIEAIAVEEGLEVLGWRALPVDPDGAGVGETALGCMPYMAQLFLAAPERNGARPGGIDLDRRVYPVRKLAEQGPEETQVYFASLSSRTITYKGMLTTMQLPQFFPDRRDERPTVRVPRRSPSSTTTRNRRNGVTTHVRRGRVGRWCSVLRPPTPRAVRDATRSPSSDSSETTRATSGSWRSPR
jgi:hypothetical protein